VIENTDFAQRLGRSLGVNFISMKEDPQEKIWKLMEESKYHPKPCNVESQAARMMKQKYGYLDTLKENYLIILASTPTSYLIYFIFSAEI
jgi:hypothetical protein